MCDATVWSAILQKLDVNRELMQQAYACCEEANASAEGCSNSLQFQDFGDT